MGYWHNNDTAEICLWSVPSFDILQHSEGNEANNKKLDLLLLMVVCIDRAQTEGFPTKDALR